MSSAVPSPLEYLKRDPVMAGLIDGYPVQEILCKRHLWKSTMTETTAILILSKATLRTGGLYALRAQAKVAQESKVHRSERLAA